MSSSLLKESGEGCLQESSRCNRVPKGYDNPVRNCHMPTQIIVSFSSSVLAFLNKQQADDEPVDPMAQVRADCLSSCPKQKKLYDSCVQRITDKKEGDCESWFIELLSCADKCVAPKIFKLTKE